MAETAQPGKSAPSPAEPARPPTAPAALEGPAPAAIRPPAAEPATKEEEERERVIIRPYPKAVFFYPVALTALICGLLSLTGWVAPATLGFVFCVVFFFNIVIMSFEFTRHVSVAVVLSIFVIVLLGMLLNERLHLVEFLRGLYAKLDWQANAGFYFALAGAFALTMLGVFIDTRMDYWEVRGNEVLHHHGFLGDVERYPAPSIRIKKEITDVFEYLLLFSGRLIVYPSGAERAIVLDNVPRINKIEAQIEELLDALHVTVEKVKER